MCYQMNTDTVTLLICSASFSNTSSTNQYWWLYNNCYPRPCYMSITVVQSYCGQLKWATVNGGNGKRKAESGNGKAETGNGRQMYWHTFRPAIACYSSLTCTKLSNSRILVNDRFLPLAGHLPRVRLPRKLSHRPRPRPLAGARTGEEPKRKPTWTNVKGTGLHHTHSPPLTTHSHS